MKYFTRERYLAMQDFAEKAMVTADTDWEAAVDRYDAYLQSIRPEMPEAVRQLADGYYLHDARVLSMGQCDGGFIVSLQLDSPPNELLTITYSLAGKPDLLQETFPWVKDATAVDWLYDEIEILRTPEQHFTHSILFSNGWEIRLPFGEVHLATALPVLPGPRGSRHRTSSVPGSRTAG